MWGDSLYGDDAKLICSSWIWVLKGGELTDGGEHAGEAEVVNGVKGQQMEEELLLLLLTAQEGIALVQLPGTHICKHSLTSPGIINTDGCKFQPVWLTMLDMLI